MLPFALARAVLRGLYIKTQRPAPYPDVFKGRDATINPLAY